MKNFKDFTTITIDPGDVVLCDYCNKDYTDLKDCGGILFQSKAICPECAPKARERIAHYKEERFIRGECPKDMPFSNWVRSIR